MNQKKVLLDFLGYLTYFSQARTEIPYNEFMNVVTETVWSVEVPSELQAKNLSDEDCETIESYLKNIQYLTNSLCDEITQSKLDDLECEIDQLAEYCQDNNIEIIDVKPDLTKN